MTNDSNQILLFFKEVEKNFVRKNGSLNFDYNLLNSNNNSLVAKWIRSKIPEFLLRGASDFEHFYDIFLEKKGEEKYDETLFSKLIVGDFQDIKALESPIFQHLSKIINNENVIARILSLNNETLDNIANYNFSFDDIVDWVIRDSLKITGFGNLNFNNYEDIKTYEEITTLAFNSSNKKKITDEVRSLKDTLAKHEEHKIKLTGDLEKINRELKKYNFLTSHLFKKQKFEYENHKKKIEDEIRQLDKIIDMNKENIERNENELSLISQYETQFYDMIKAKIIPIIRDYINKSNDLNQDEKMKIDGVVDKLFSKEFLEISSGKPFSVLGKIPTAVNKFYNALTTISNIPQAFISFEENGGAKLPLFSENGDEPSLLGIIRMQLSNVPADGDHGKIEAEKYRDYKVYSTFNNFFGKVVAPKDIESSLRKLNDEYNELMQTSNIDDYIRKSGILYYKFLLIHPYSDGNGRTGRYLLNILLAHKNIIIPSFYNSLSEATSYTNSLDDFVVNRLDANYDELGDFFLKKVRELGANLSLPREVENNQILSEDVSIDGIHQSRNI